MNITIAVKHLLSPRYKYLRKYTIGPNDIVIDLGANVGQETAFFLRKKAEVHAYEPNPHAFSQLEKNTRAYDKVRIHHKAVSNYNGKSKLFLHRDHGKSELAYSQASSLRGEKNNLSADHVEVDVIDIREVLAPHPKIRLLKIDIEGGEYDIMDTVLEHAGKIDHVLLETHEKKYPEFREKGEILQKKIDQSPYKNRICTDWF